MPTKAKSIGAKKIKRTQGGKGGIDQKALYSGLIKLRQYGKYGSGLSEKESVAVERVILLAGVAAGVLDKDEAGGNYEEY